MKNELKKELGLVKESLKEPKFEVSEVKVTEQLTAEGGRGGEQRSL